MANVASAKKRIRQTETRSERNRHYRSIIRNQRKQLLSAIEAGELKPAQEKLNTLTAMLHRIASKGIIHRNRAAGWVSSLSKRVAAIK